MARINCAIYTRKSTEHGLDMEFNSLQNQEESCKAYILSQAFNGWEYYKQTSAFYRHYGQKELYRSI